MRKLLLVFVLAFPITSYSQAVNENLAVVEKYFDLLFKKGDFQTLPTIISDKAIYTQAEGLPYGGKYYGFTEWLIMFQKVQTYFELHIEGDPIFFENKRGNKVVVNFNVSFTLKKSRKTISMPVTELFEIKEGKIIGITPYYFDTKTITDFIKSEI
jgi:hypothetical protein